MLFPHVSANCCGAAIDSAATHRPATAREKVGTVWEGEGRNLVGATERIFIRGNGLYRSMLCEVLLCLLHSVDLTFSQKIPPGRALR